MTITATVIADSMNPWGGRLTTMELTYPRMIHSELMTHRAFSRNAASSRAIPTKRFRQDVRTNCAKPSRWGKAAKGMQDGGELSPTRQVLMSMVWALACRCALVCHWLAEKTGVSKQVANRLLEPFFHITTLVTATEEAWEGFLALRKHDSADPTIQALAVRIEVALDDSDPTPLHIGDWHLPYVGAGFALYRACKQEDIMQSVARCARVSYRTFDGGNSLSTMDADKQLYSRLVHNNPPHASPTEHQAVVSLPNMPFTVGRNFGDSSGWAQYRGTLNI